MPTATLYNHAAKLFANGEVNLADLKLMLLNNHSFSAAHTNISSIEADEVSGAGWDAGGEAIANAAVTTVNTDEAKLDADDVSVTATGGNIGPADGAVIYQDSVGEEYPLVYIDFEGEQTAGEGTPFNVNWNAAGIISWPVP